MKRKLLFGVLIALSTSFVSAQEMPQQKIRLSIAPNATKVKFAVKSDTKNKPLVCDFGEGVKSYDNVSSTELTNKEYTFTTAQATERVVDIAADNLYTFRVVNSNEVNGLLYVESNTLRNLNLDYVSLLDHNKVDLTNCPQLLSATFTATGIEEVVLPKSNVFESIQASGTMAGEGTLKRVNLQDVPNLREIGFVGASIDTLDVRNNPYIQTLVCSLPKKVTRAILGAKNLEYIKTLDVRGNALGFEQLPDKYIEDEPLENFRYSAQGAYLVAKHRVNGMTIDLSDLQTAKGIATTYQQTSFVWKYKPNRTAKYVDVPEDKMEVVNGKFTFDPTLSEDDTLRVYCTMSNPGYPGIGKKNANTIGTYMIKLLKVASGIENTTHTNAINIENKGSQVTIFTERKQKGRIYDTAGKCIWSGMIPATLDLPKGIYMLKTEEGDNIKFIK